MKSMYKIYKERNNESLIDLVVKEEGDKYFVEDKIHDIKLEGLSQDEINVKLNELKASEDTKLEIKKAILNKHMGRLEIEQDKIGSKLSKHKGRLEGSRKDFENELKEFEDNIFREIKDINDKINEFFL